MTAPVISEADAKKKEANKKKKEKDVIPELVKEKEHESQECHQKYYGWGDKEF